MWRFWRWKGGGLSLEGGQVEWVGGVQGPRKFKVGPVSKGAAMGARVVRFCQKKKKEDKEESR